MTFPPPVRYAPTVEDVQPDEAATIVELKSTFDTVLETTSKDYGHAVRAVHAKAHGVFEGTLTVEGGLPRELAQGLFAQPGGYRVYLRISTNAGDILRDSISLPRGLALKVLDVPGERLPDAEGNAQDFVLINGPVFMTKTADQFLGNLKLLAKTTDVGEGAKAVLSAVMRGVNTALTAVGIESPKVQSLGGAPNSDPLGETYYSVTPFRYGDHIAKFGVRPVSPSLVGLSGRKIDASGDPDAIRNAMRAEMAGIDAEWELRVQLCRDLDKQPVEDPTVEWKEADTPFEKVATIRVQHQDSWDPARVQAIDEAMRFSIWTGLAAHQPLGNINRARNDTYRRSAAFRARFNGCPIREP